MAMPIFKRAKSATQAAANTDNYPHKPSGVAAAKVTHVNHVIKPKTMPTVVTTAAKAANTTADLTINALPAPDTMLPNDALPTGDSLDHTIPANSSTEYSDSLHPALAINEQEDEHEENPNAHDFSADDAVVEAQDDAALAESHAIFEAELMPHIRSLYHFAYRLTSDEDEANDLVQDTYMKAFRFIKSYERGSNAKAWLFRILKNSFINNYRKTSKEPNKIDYEEAENYLNAGRSAIYSDTIDMRDKMFRGLIGDEVSHALNALPVDFRTVIILCDIEEFTYEEIAKIIDIPIGTVRSRLHRARKMLRDLLLEYAVSLGYDTDE